MLKNYLKTALRSLRANKAHSFINIGGLAVGMAVALLIGLWIRDELSFDRSNINHERIARIMQNITANGEVETWGSTPFPTADELRSHYGDNFKAVVLGTDPARLTLSDGKKPISLVIAIPVSTWFMHHWLQQYTYRAPLSWWIFAATATGTLLITLLTVSWQAIRAALANPVRSLRSE